MFDEILEPLSRDELAEVTYLTARVLWYRHLLSTTPVDEIVGKGSGRGTLSSRARHAISELLSKIERREGPLESLDAKKVDNYLRELSEIVRSRSNSDLGVDHNRARRLLQELRHA